MSKQEVQNLSDKDLIAHWDAIKAAYGNSFVRYLSDHQSLILFADFVNISHELKKRNLCQ